MSTDSASGSATPYRRLSEPAYHGKFISRYDHLRPTPPRDLFELLASMAPTQPPELVVDLGAGTGISTVPWAAHATQVIGIDVNHEMLRVARQAPGVEYRVASAQQTGLPSACADVVTCAQSLHWMPYQPTIAEVARLLRPGGCFAAYDYDWPPLIDPEADAVFLQLIEAAGVDPNRPEKASHVERLAASGRFRFVREVFLHAREVVGVDHLAELPLAFGPVARKLDEGVSPRELGLDRLQHVLRRRLDAAANTVWWSYRVRIAIK
jgi:ubiquinone/menaquinone biosynthesis C-methylase UbiE